MSRLLILLTVVVLVLGIPVAAQEQTLLSLQTSTTSLQTGQEYDITIRIDGVPEMWLANMEISYDPNLLYIIGTQAGSPVRGGDFFAPPEAVFIARNLVQGSQINYTISLLAPANPVSGSGVIGTFRVYPIAPGTTQLAFTSADLTMLVFSGEGDQRTGTDPFHLDFTPVLLELNITGDAVEPPSEATATPAPTETATSAFIPGEGRGTAEPTLVNATAAPQTLATLPAPGESPASSASPVLLLAIAAMLIGAVGLVVLFIRSRRR